MNYFYFLMFLAVLTGLTLNWWYFYYRKVLSYRKEKKELDNFLGKLKVVEVYGEENGITQIIISEKFSKTLLSLENLTPEYFIKISYPKRVDKHEFWGKNTFYRKFTICSPQGVFLKSYKAISKK